MARKRCSVIALLAAVLLIPQITVAQRRSNVRVNRSHPRSRMTINSRDPFRRTRSRSIYSRYARYPRNLYYRNLYRPYPYRSSFYGFRPGFYLQYGYPRFGYPYYGFRRYSFYNFSWPTYYRFYNYDPFCFNGFYRPIVYRGIGDFAQFDLAPTAGGANLYGNAISPNVLNGINAPEVRRLLEEHEQKRKAAREARVIETPEELLAAAMIETNRRRPPSSLMARKKCRESMVNGDRLFAEKKYANALNQYKQASTFAPDIAESFFRQGHAYLASNRLRLAARSFQRGFDVEPDIKRRGFALSQLYDDKKNPIPKKLHFDELARTALQKPTDPEAYLLIGLMLHYDGEKERAQKFFRQAEQIPARKYRFNKLFLPKAEKKAIDL